ncbi:hypothetical protein [Hymenobacter canadensis]|uniref:Histone H1 n=1 Tax=Hymenobacter canadensis TaxID=2999067 RepID=A0ABY7LY07_9BACT|nr:hypothetical protein [Hymenobacter canadensis]WBA44155.1 hypothetical protein O3303_19900 [Hymenobacter canadensis]
MTKSQQQLQVTLAECLQVNLGGLNTRHAKKLQKTIANASKKLARKYARFEAKEQKGAKKAKPLAALPAPKKQVLRVIKTVPQPTAKRAAPVARGAQKKSLPGKVAAQA